MKKQAVQKLARWLFLPVVAVLTLSCGILNPKPTGTAPPSPISPIAISVLPTPPAVDIHGRVLLQLISTPDALGASLEISNPDGSDRQMLAEMASEMGTAAVSPDHKYLAFFTTDGTRDGALVIWNLADLENAFSTPVPAEITLGFRDSLPERYLAWSPDSQKLACVMNRDLHLVDVAAKNIETLVRHKEAGYTLAGRVLGAIKHPTWSADKVKIIYDAFHPPDILSASADQYRSVEYVNISNGTTTTLLELELDTYIESWIVMPGEQEVILTQDGSSFSVSLNTLFAQASSPPPFSTQPVCRSDGKTCAATMSIQHPGDQLRVDFETQVHDIHIADLGEKAVGCHFSSVLWNPEGTSLLATTACADRASLWSITMTDDAQVAHITDWADASEVMLLAWFK